MARALLLGPAMTGFESIHDQLDQVRGGFGDPPKGCMRLKDAFPDRDLGRAGDNWICEGANVKRAPVDPAPVGSGSLPNPPATSNPSPTLIGPRCIGNPWGSGCSLGLPGLSSW